jgi:hypothetical protein
MNRDIGTLIEAIIQVHRGAATQFLDGGYSDARLGGGSQQSVSAGPGDGLLPRGDIKLVEHRGNVIFDGAG